MYLQYSDKNLYTANTSVGFGINIFTTKLLQTLYYVAVAELKIFKVSACVIVNHITCGATLTCARCLTASQVAADRFSLCAGQAGGNRDLQEQ